MRILIAEDEKSLNRVLVKELQANHYTVDSCRNGEEAWEYLTGTAYDAVILDIMMPKMDGLTLLKKIRDSSNRVPVLLLTARDSVEDRVKGLDTGADDYLSKPFSIEELTARIRVMLRRKSDSATNCFTIANLTVDCDTRKVFRGEAQIALSSKEFAILEYMIRNQDIVLTRDQIERHIWNYEYEGGTNVVDVYIRYLRKKLDEGYEPKLIQTIRGTGYVLRVGQ